MRQWRAGALIAGIVALSVIAGVGIRGARPDTAHAQTGQAWDVLVGTDVEATFVSAQTYFPQVITVVQGDTVNWTFAGFHTVTFPAGGPPPALVVPGPNPGELMLGPGYFPVPPGPDVPSGPYDGSSPISSGAPPDEADPQDDAAFVFSLSFTRAGTYWYLCTIHPGMEGTVVVLPSGSSAPESPAQAKARGERELVARTAMLNALVANVDDEDASSRGVRAHTVAMGVGVGGMSKLAFLPDELEVRRGDIVTFFLADPYEIHTVTFTSGAEPPEFVEPRFGPGGPGSGPPMLVIPANVAGPSGPNDGHLYTGTGIVNSGIHTIGMSHPITIDAPAGTYEYLCLIHPFMTGTITVVE